MRDGYLAVKLLQEYMTNTNKHYELFQKIFTIYTNEKLIQNKKMVLNTILESYSPEIREKLYSDQDGLGK